MKKKALFVIGSFVGFCLILLGLKMMMIPIRVSEDISADLNGNGVVDIADFIICGNAFGATPDASNWNEKADLKKDGRINALDFSIIGRYYGSKSIIWIDMLTLLNIFTQENQFVVFAIGLYVAFLIFIWDKVKQKLGVILLYVRHYILRLLKRHIHIQ